MASDNDLSASLPQPPPPRPDRREAAIEAAMRRFDGAADPAGAAERPRAARAAPWRIGRPQMGALVTAALVAAIGLPVWMATSDRLGAPERQAPSPATPGPVAGQPSLPQPAATPGPASLAPVAPTPGSAPVPATATPARSNADKADGRTEEIAASRAAESTQNDASPQAMQMKQMGSVAGRVASFDRAEAPAPPPPPPPPEPVPMMAAPAAMAEQRASARDDIVVTGTAMRSPAAVRRARNADGRGDWNACTINDPNRDLAACRKLVDPAAPGSTGRASAHVADGLSLAWRGDTDGAIAAFDQAIGIAPKLAIAWLNRGLAYERRGDLPHAIADLDKAVRYAPGTARVYYNRSLLLRQRGDVRRADADAERALDLDARYEAVIE
jgi:hypothetical protein